MKKLLMAMLVGWALIPVAGWAQNSDSLNIAADQAVSMNKLDDLSGRAQKRLSYIMTNLADLTDGNDSNNSFDKFKENLEDLQDIRSDIKDRVEKVRDLQGQRMAAWTKEVSGMTDKDMRKMTNDQIDKAKADFDALDKQLREVGGDAGRRRPPRATVAREIPSPMPACGSYWIMRRTGGRVPPASLCVIWGWRTPPSPRFPGCKT